MPIKSQEEYLSGLSPQVTSELSQEESPKEDVSFGEGFVAGFKRENPIASVIDNGLQDRYITNPNYDPISPLKGTDYEQHQERFIYADSDEEVQRVKDQIDRELNTAQIIQDSGWAGTIGAMAGGLIDPTILIPGTAALKSIRAGRIIRGAAGAASGAGLGVGAVAAQEVVLHSTQVTREAEESAINIATGGLLGGALGGAIGLLSKGARGASEAVIQETLRGGGIPLKLNPDGGLSVGAAEAASKISDESIAHLNERVVRGVTGFDKVTRSPIVEGLIAPFETSKRITNELFEHNIILGKNIRGEASPVSLETRVKLKEADVIDIQRAVDTGVESLNKRLSKEGGEGFSRQRFNEEVSSALRRGDVHDIPEVAAAAREMRGKISAMTKELQRVGILAEDLDTKFADSYLSRVYDIRKLSQPQLGEDFKKVLVRHFTTRKGLDEVDAREVADSTLNNILGIGENDLGINQFQRAKTKSGKFTKERVLDVPDEDLEPFLVNNAEEIVSKYTYQAAHLIEYQDFLARMGVETDDELRGLLQNEFNNAYNKAKLDSDKVQLKKEFERARELLDDQIKIATGQFGKKGLGDGGLRLLRKYQTVRLLGGVLLSSFPDMFMAVVKHGLSNTIRDGYLPLIRNLSAAKLSRNQLKDMAVGLELEMNSMLKAAVDPEFRLNQNLSSVDVRAEQALSLFGRVTGLSHWNNFHKRLAGSVSSARTLRSVDNYSNLKQAEKERLAVLGIDGSMATRISDQFKRFGDKVDGSYISNVALWSDKEASDVFKASVLKDVDSTVITPGRGDISRLAQGSELGKTIFQFRSFSQGVTNKLLIPSLQRRDAAVVQGVVGLIGMGMAVYTIKQMINGKSPVTDPDKLIQEGLARSGVLGLVGDTAFALNPFTSSSRYAHRNIQSTLFGPSPDMIGQAYQVGTKAARTAIGEDRWTKSDTKKAVQLLPLMNLFYLRWALEQANK